MVVTGAGVVAAPGVGADSFWKGITVDPGIGPYVVEAWDPEPWIPLKEHRRLDRFTQFALVAADEALRQSGPLSAEPERVAVSIGTGIGGLASLEALVGASTFGQGRASPLWVPMMMCNAAAASISIKYGFGGPATTPVVACAAGAQALADAFRAIQWGYADAALAGGSEAAVRQGTIDGFDQRGRSRPPGLPGPSIAIATASSWVRGQPCSSWKSGTLRSSAAPPSWQSWPAPPQRPTPTTSPLPIPREQGPSEQCATPCRMRGSRPSQSDT